MFTKLIGKKEEGKPSQKTPQNSTQLPIISPDSSAPDANAAEFTLLKEAIEQGTLADIEKLWAESPALFQGRMRA